MITDAALRAPALDEPVLVEPAPPTDRRVRAWVRDHRRGVLTVASVLAISAAAHAWGMSRAPSFFDDEGTYVAQAWAVTKGALAHYTYWYDHPPLGWVQIGLWTWLTGAFARYGSAVAAGREAMLVAHLVSVGLLYLLGRRLGLRRAFAAAAALAYALSPLAIEHHRMVYLDNVATPWVLAAFVLALSPRRHLWITAGAGACMAVAVLTKETTLIVLPAVAWQVWSHGSRRTRDFCLTAFVSTFALAVLLYPLFALLRGELLPGPGHVSLISALKWQLFDRPSTGSILTPGSASSGLFLQWWRTDPWLLSTAAMSIPLGFAVRKLRPVTLALALQVLLMVRPGYLPAPYIIGMLPFAALLPPAVANDLWDTVRVPPRGRFARRRLASWARPAALAGPLVVVATAVVLIAAAAPAWVNGHRRLATTNAVAPLVEARDWIPRHIPPGSRVLVDDTLWLDLVRRGFGDQLGVVWFYKLDFTNNLDPSVAEQLPGGWREFDYYVSTPIIREALADQPSGLSQVRELDANSVPIAAFGAGDARVEVRRVDKEAPA